MMSEEYVLSDGVVDMKRQKQLRSPAQLNVRGQSSAFDARSRTLPVARDAHQAGILGHLAVSSGRLYGRILVNYGK